MPPWDARQSAVVRPSRRRNDFGLESFLRAREANLTFWPLSSGFPPFRAERRSTPVGPRVGRRSPTGRHGQRMQSRGRLPASGAHLSNTRQPSHEVERDFVLESLALTLPGESREVLSRRC